MRVHTRTRALILSVFQKTMFEIEIDRERFRDRVALFFNLLNVSPVTITRVSFEMTITHTIMYNRVKIEIFPASPLPWKYIKRHEHTGSRKPLETRSGDTTDSWCTTSGSLLESTEEGE